jgi:FPC/CPF motif-containing protein YcgG
MERGTTPVEVDVKHDKLVGAVAPLRLFPCIDRPRDFIGRPAPRQYPAIDPFRLEDGDNHPLAERFREFIRDGDFPCVGAKSALGRDQLKIIVARDILSSWDDLRIYVDLLAFAKSYREAPKLFQSFVVLFEQPARMTEGEFEKALWTRVQSFADKDAWHGQGYDPRVSADPKSPHFSLSFGTEAFFVVGLHPCASRPARRFERPAIVFNLHDQFERLRAEKRYESLRHNIIERDVAIAGSPNPMLARHGEISEARQYSGRSVGEDWTCPFSATSRVEIDDP